MSLWSASNFASSIGRLTVAPVHVLLARRLLARRTCRSASARCADRSCRPAGPSAARWPSDAAERFLVQCRRAQVPVDASRPNNPQCLETVRPLNLYRHAVDSL